MAPLRLAPGGSPASPARPDPGRMLVVKLGGSLLEGASPRTPPSRPKLERHQANGSRTALPRSGDALAEAVADVAGLWAQGRRLVVVHGVSVEADALIRRLGEEPRHVTSASGMPSRYTPPEHLEAYVMAAAAVNARLTGALLAAGAPALGLLPHGGRLLEARRQQALIVREADGRKRVLRDDQTGRVEKVNGGLLRRLLDEGYLPVLAPLAAGADGEPLNVDGDRAAALVAAALEAEALVLLTDAPGLLARFPDPASLVRTAGREELEALMGMARGRMKKKVHAAGAALQAGVGRVILAAGHGPEPVSRALAGEGTVIA